MSLIAPMQCEQNEKTFKELQGHTPAKETFGEDQEPDVPSSTYNTQTRQRCRVNLPSSNLRLLKNELYLSISGLRHYSTAMIFTGDLTYTMFSYYLLPKQAQRMC